MPIATEPAIIFWDARSSLQFYNTDGEMYESRSLEECELPSVFTPLLTTGQFTELPPFKILLNIQHVSRLYSSRDKGYRTWLNIATSTDPGKSDAVFKIPVPSPHIGVAFDHLLKTSKPFCNVPGSFDMLNYNMLSDIRYNMEEKLEFYNTKGDLWVTSRSISPDTAKFTQSEGLAAIRALKAFAPRPATQSKPAGNLTTAQSPEKRNRLRALPGDLKTVIFGQDHAIDVLADAIYQNYAGLKNKKQPVGSFIFMGPTGVGKTELALQTALALGYDYKKFDMSEYMSEVNASRLTGGSPNHVGYEEGGELTNFALDHPRSVIVFDEIEKAHPNIANLLLQVMEDGCLTDGKGKTALFNECLIIMTSNLGTEERREIGLHAGMANTYNAAAVNPRNNEAVKRFFRPEFLNRVTDVVQFNALTPEIMMTMTQKFMRELEGALEPSNVSLTLSPLAMAYFAREGYDPAMGARPLKRLIEKKLGTPLSREILFGALENGGAAVVDVKDDGHSLSFTYTATQAARAASVPRKKARGAAPAAP